MAGQLFVSTTKPAGTRSMPDGINVAWAAYSTTTVTLSVSDIVNMLAIPEGAVIIDGYVCGIIKTGTGAVVKVGIGAAGAASATGVATDADFIASVTLSTTRVLSRFTGITTNLPYAVPAIAAATYPKSYPINVTMISGTVTVSVSFQLSIIYVAAGQ